MFSKFEAFFSNGLYDFAFFIQFGQFQAVPHVLFLLDAFTYTIAIVQNKWQGCVGPFQPFISAVKVLAVVRSILGLLYFLCNGFHCNV